MKKIAIAAIVLVAGLVAYNYSTTGELSLIPSFSVSAEEQQVRDLEERFEMARKQFAQAHRTASVGGIDTTSDVMAAQREIGKIGKELAQLRKKLSEDGAKRRADELRTMLEEFQRELR